MQTLERATRTGDRLDGRGSIGPTREVQVTGRDDGGSRFPLPRLGADVGHLTTEAVAAYVDGELSTGSHMRAGAHLSRCPACRAAVAAQRDARAALQQAPCPAPTEDLLTALGRIPQTEPGPETGDEDGPSAPRRRRWPGRR